MTPDIPIPVPKEPAYKSWSLEKLQQEYFLLRLTLTAAELRNLDYEEDRKKVIAFVEALKDLTESDLT